MLGLEVDSITILHDAMPAEVRCHARRAFSLREYACIARAAR